MGDEGSALEDNADGVIELSEQGEKLTIGATMGTEVVGYEQGGNR